MAVVDNFTLGKGVELRRTIFSLHNTGSLDIKKK